ncbi:hypothetical protein AB1Y20_014527 [Prymnesium parvum]|uniref:Mitochondrial carrier protein n=1 Tax=Prymnesium parvum TaxID=97485 RepID=A0AB34ID60_PRYPA
MAARDPTQPRLLEGLAHATSGALASAVAFSLLFPLDQLRLRRQCLVRGELPLATSTTMRLLKQILKHEGVRGLYKGLPTSAFAIVVANFFYFFYYNLLRQRLRTRDSGALRTIAIPAIAGVMNVLSLNPLFVLAARLRVARQGEFGSVLDCLRKLCHEGPATLWGGVVPSLWLVSNPAIQYFVYERLKELLRYHAKRANREVSSVEHFVAGAISKTTATIATYPLQVAQTLLRTQRPPRVNQHWNTEVSYTNNTTDPKREAVGAPSLARSGVSPCNSSSSFEKNSATPLVKREQTISTESTSSDALKSYKGMVECLVWVWRERGIGGLYCGLANKLWQTVLTASLMFAIYERLAAVSLNALRIKHQSAVK